MYVYIYTYKYIYIYDNVADTHTHIYMRFMKLDIPGNGMMFSMTSSHGWLMGWFIIWFTALAYNTSGIYIYMYAIYTYACTHIVDIKEK